MKNGFALGQSLADQVGCFLFFLFRVLPWYLLALQFSVVVSRSVEVDGWFVE